MIISIFVVEEHSDKKLFRSSSPMTSAQMNYYLTEFLSLSTIGDGVYENETYNFVYSSNNSQKFGIQITKDHSTRSAFQTLKFIMQNSTEDIFDTLVVIDNTLYGGISMQLELTPILELNSQEEKIHKMMMENKRLEMAQREKEYKIRTTREHHISKHVEEPVENKIPETKPKKQEVSNKPILVVIREKLNITVDKENKVVQNLVNGEVLMIISDSKYKHVEIKMKNLKSAFKFSPYLDKNALKKSILRFDRDRGLNKSIPLLKWSGTRQKIPFEFEFWNDEEEDKIVSILEIKPQIDSKEIEIKFNKKNVTDIEVNEDHTIEENEIIWYAKNLNKNESKAIEIRCCAFDKDCLLPIHLSFISGEVDSMLEVEKMTVEQEEVTDFEVRKIVEVEHFRIVSGY